MNTELPNATDATRRDGSPLTEGLGAWVPTADLSRLPDFDVPVWLYEDGRAWIGCRVYDSDGWLWAKCYLLPYLDEAGAWKLADAEADDDYSPTLWQPMPEPPRYAQPELDSAAADGRRLAANLNLE